MPTQIMLDLETWGVTAGSSLAAIGAVKFGAGTILDSFYSRIDAVSCEQIGLKMDAATVLWWMGRSDEARAELTGPGREPIVAVLTRFSAWIGDPEAEIWGNGPSLDCVLLEAAYKAAGLPRPWTHLNERCYRTARRLLPKQPWQRTGTHHNALDDATSQALHLMAAMATVQPVVPVEAPQVIVVNVRNSEP